MSEIEKLVDAYGSAERNYGESCGGGAEAVDATRAALLAAIRGEQEPIGYASKSWVDYPHISNDMPIMRKPHSSFTVPVYLHPFVLPTHKEIASSINNGTDKCPLCARAVPHEHSPEEIIIYRNGVKFGSDNTPPPVSEWVKVSERLLEGDMNRQIQTVNMGRFSPEVICCRAGDVTDYKFTHWRELSQLPTDGGAG